MKDYNLQINVLYLYPKLTLYTYYNFLNKTNNIELYLLIIIHTYIYFKSIGRLRKIFVLGDTGKERYNEEQ